MFERSSLKWPITLGVTMIVLLVLVIVGWILLAVFGAERAAENALVYWTLLSVGTIVLALILLGVIAYLVLSIKSINLNRRQSNFLDSVTHELRSPIASLKLSLQTMNRHKVSPEQASTFHKFMLEDVERLDHLITHLLAAGSIEKKNAYGDVSTFDLEELIRQLAVAASQRYGLQADCIEFDTEPCWVTTRSVDIELILRNIVDNALKYGGDPPAVEIWMRRNVKGNIMISVSDNGRGIPPGMRRKIFQRFVRLGSELTREKPGTGLGLHIVRTLVQRLGGKISVHDCESGEGTLFQLELPGKLRPRKVLDCCLSKATKSLPLNFGVASMTDKPGSQILVVEDESHIAFGIKFNLEAEGFHVLIAEDGPIALKMIEDPEHQFQLIILDLMLPGMSGYAVCRQLREAGNDVPILMLSARSLAEDRTQGFDAGTNQYLTKPFDLEELISRVKNLLSAGKTRQSSTTNQPGRLKRYEFGQAVIDFEAYEARVNHKTVRLTALQLKLLEYFIEHEGRVVTRQELLENVWELPGYVKSRPDQFLRQLRKTFEAEPSHPKHFLTVRDVGYRFVLDPQASYSQAEPNAPSDADR